MTTKFTARLITFHDFSKRPGSTCVRFVEALEWTFCHWTPITSTFSLWVFGEQVFLFQEALFWLAEWQTLATEREVGSGGALANASVMLWIGQQVNPTLIKMMNIAWKWTCTVASSNSMISNAIEIWTYHSSVSNSSARIESWSRYA